MTDPVTVGDLFPADDVLAQWVFSLTAAVEDLSITEALFRDALDADAPFYRTSPLFRLLMTRMIEAERPIQAMAEHPAVRAFVSDLAVEEVAFLVDMFRD